jgi:uncharacterized protein YutE (UPF0331/DUF86 family)
MKPLDPERMEKLVSSMRGAIKLLGELRDLPVPEFMADPHKQSSAKYNFTAAIEAAIDIASHVISRKGLRAPEDYADTFQVLSEAGILPADFTGELKKMARFRNRLVHIYWDVDTAELRRILETKLSDFNRYLSEIGAYMAREERSIGCP